MEAKQTINYTKSNIGGWRYCEMRKYLRHNVFDNLPDDLKLIIKPVDKLTSKGEENDEIETTSDKLFLLSESEVFDKIVNSAIGEGNQYQYFVDGGFKIKYRLDSSYSWWLRSPDVGGKTCFNYINSTPSCNRYATDGFDGVVFGFCI